MKTNSFNFIWIGIAILMILCDTAMADVIEDVSILTDSPRYELCPVWTNDGKIIYLFESDTWNNREIYIMDADGTNQQQLGVSVNKLAEISDISPNGEELLLVINSGNWFDIYKLNIETGTLTPLAADSSKVECYGFWSPDGTKIAYVQDDELWMMDSNGDSKHLVCELEDLGSEKNWKRVGPGMDWTPEGTKIIFSVADTNDNDDLWMINTDKTGLIQLTNTDYSEWHPTFSPDGKYIAYASSEGNSGTYQNKDMWIRNIDGTYKERLTTEFGVHDATPHWSADGKEIVFCGNQWPMPRGGADIALLSIHMKKPQFNVKEVSDGVVVETPRVKYHLANGGFARELWVDHNGDGVYDENIGFEDATLQYPYLAFGSWGVIISKSSGGETYAGSVGGGEYSYNIVEETEEKMIVDFTSTFETITATVRWEIYPNGDAKIIPWTADPMENTYSLMYTWWVKPQQNDIVGMRLTPDTEVSNEVTFTGSNSQIATPDFTKAIITQADFSDLSLSHPYQFYQDTTDDYTLLVVEPKTSVEDDWEWVENSQANDALWGGRLSYDSPSNPLYYAAGLVDWAWYYDPAPEEGGTAEPRESPTTQPINQDQKFAFYVHWMWGDTNEEDRYAAAGDIAEYLALNEPKNYDDLTIVHLTDVHMGYALTLEDLKVLSAYPGNTREEIQKHKERIDEINRKMNYEQELKLQYFSDAMQDIQNLNPDLILVTGDLVEYNDEHFFGDFITIIDNKKNLNLNVITGSNDKILCVPGNHDRRIGIDSEGLNIPIIYDLSKYQELIAPWYPDEREKIPLGTNGDYYIKREGYYFIGLDSGEDTSCRNPEGTPEGSGLTGDQITSLEVLDSEIPKIIFMHHPVISDESDNNDDWEDPIVDTIVNEGVGNNHCIVKNRLRFIEYCKSNTVLAVLTGHTHHVYVYDQGYNLVNLIPSDVLVCSQHNSPYFVQTQSLTKDAEHDGKKFNHGYSIINISDDKLNSITSVETSLQKRWTGTLACPANLHVYDSDGSHTGQNERGSELGIPNSYYYKSYDIYIGDETKIHRPETIILYDMEKDYTFEIQANFSEEDANTPENQHFNFILEKQDENDVTELSYTNVPLTENTVARLQVSDDTTEFIMQIDMDGDGTIDEKREPDLINNDETLNSESSSYSDTNESINTSIEGDYSNDEVSASTIYKDIQSTVDSMIEEINPQVPSDLKNTGATSNFYSIGLILILVIGVIMLYRKS